MSNKYDCVMERIRYRHVPDYAPASEEGIAQFERELGHPLPPDYREFLAEYGFSAGHGGIVCSVVNQPPEHVAGVEVFYGLNPGQSRDLRRKRRTFGGSFARPPEGVNFDSRGFDHLDDHLLAIASSPGGQICIGLYGPDRGKVYWWFSGGQDPDDDEPRLDLLAHDFDSFMNSLRPADYSNRGGA